MLSYRHAFHAGNHADILKHFVLAETLTHVAQKEKPYWVIDTHAGAGLYSLEQGYATKNAEFESGISRLFAAPELPEPIARFVSLIKRFNPDNTLSFYPGSPKIAECFLREQDKMRLFELHPSDHKILAENFSAHGKQIKVEMSDGFSGLKSLLPPPPRRGVILIDPPYEEKQDYQRVVSAIKDALTRFATGTYLIWYPLLQRSELHDMIEQLQRLDIPSWLDVTLTVAPPSTEGFGMYGSGMFVINPPWKLAETLNQCMPVLVDTLRQAQDAEFNLSVQMR